MELTNILENVIIPLFATFIGAFFAFRYQYQIEKRKEKRGVLQYLVAFRNVGADDLEWIKMMNVVDLIFHNDEKVRQLYGRYLELTDPDRVNTYEYVEVYYEMIYEMAKACGYSELTQSDLKKFYAPIGLRQHYPAPKKRKQHFPRYRLLRSIALLRQHRFKRDPKSVL